MWRLALVRDFLLGPGRGGEPRDLTVFGGELYFTLFDPRFDEQAGRSRWR
jgi:hypothetical protein